MTRRRLLAAAALALVVVAHLALVLPGLFLTHLWEDEAYNLTVPMNLVAGHGYASDGILTLGAIHPFDFRISTGPVVLLPIAAMLATGIDPVLGGRLVMALFYVGYLVVLWFVGRRLAGAWGGVLALGVALAFDGSRAISPLQGPTDILGEIPAATGILLFLLLFQRRPLLAGLLLGLAVQSKTLAVLAVPAALVAVLVVAGGRPWRRLARTAAVAAAVALPTLVFEAVKLLVLGPAAYISSTRDLYYFLRSGGQSAWGGPPLFKAEVLLGSWSLPVSVAALLVVAALGAALVVAVRWRRLELPVPHSAPLIAAAAGVLLVWCGWWFVSAGLPPWVRHPSPALLAAVPVLVTGLAAAVGRVVAAEGIGARRVGAALASAGAVLLLVGGIAHVAAIWNPPATLSDQRALAARIGESTDGTLGGFWGSIAPMAVLSGNFPVIVADHPVHPDVPVLVFAGDAGPDLVQKWTDEFCARTIFTDGGYRLCSQER
jgi:hypothetical protein